MKKLSSLELKLEMANSSVLLTSVVYFFWEEAKGITSVQAVEGHRSSFRRCR